MKKKTTRAEKRPARNASFGKISRHSLTGMGAEDVEKIFGHIDAGGETKKRQRMGISGKSVFKIKEIIDRKSKR
jgi:hypothetical protein